MARHRRANDFDLPLSTGRAAPGRPPGAAELAQLPQPLHPTCPANLPQPPPVSVEQRAPRKERNHGDHQRPGAFTAPGRRPPPGDRPGRARRGRAHKAGQAARASCRGQGQAGPSADPMQVCRAGLAASAPQCALRQIMQASAAAATRILDDAIDRLAGRRGIVAGRWRKAQGRPVGAHLVGEHHRQAAIRAHLGTVGDEGDGAVGSRTVGAPSARRRAPSTHTAARPGSSAMEVVAPPADQVPDGQLPVAARRTAATMRW